MRTTTLVDSPHFQIRSVACTEHHVGWSAPEPAPAAHLVLVRRGRFLIRSCGRRTTADPTMGYLHPPGHETSFSHPAGGDLCTSITVPGDLVAGIDPSSVRPVRVDARLELTHRRLLRTGDDPDFAAAEAVVRLLPLALRHRPDESPAPGRYELADRAREVILAGEPGGATLIGLARLVGVSPAHLSRTFRHHAGMSVSRYRNRVRVSRAFQYLSDGEADLAGLALSLGFSDQAHFTRTMTSELGQSPGRIRDILGPGTRQGDAAIPRR